MKQHPRKSFLIIVLALFFLLSACKPNWEIQITENNEFKGTIQHKDVVEYIEKSNEELQTIPLGQFLYNSDYTLIDQVTLITESNDSGSFNWDSIAADAVISAEGEILINDEGYQPATINVEPSQVADTIEYSIMDIAPSVAQVMGLPSLPDPVGEARLSITGDYDHAVMILLDGVQYNKLQSLVNTGRMPFFERFGTIEEGTTVFPPVTTSSTAAFLTGVPPLANGVFGYGYRSTDLTTLFDIADEAGKTVIAVEGYGLAFNLRNADVTLSGDLDNNGYTNDNVYENSMQVIQTEMPDLLYIHFHDVDDMGHEFGPNSEEYETSLIQMDEYLANIYNVLPQNTFVVIFADHGMHTTDEGGNHGTLMSLDMIIPILFFSK